MMRLTYKNLFVLSVVGRQKSVLYFSYQSGHQHTGKASAKDGTTTEILRSGKEQL